MVKENTKRKARLNKGESGGSEFIGFAAFADTPSTSPLSSPTTTATPDAFPLFTSTSSLSPIYTGSDSTLSVLFPRIGQKRDSTTKAKALSELVLFFQKDNAAERRVQVEALSHFLYLYRTKLSYDNTSRIRSLSIQVCQAARQRLPKAWTNLTSGTDVLGMVACARSDPALEVRTVAMEFGVIHDGDEMTATVFRPCYEGMWMYVSRILSYGKPISMYQDLFQKKGSTTTSPSEEQKEAMEERYERIVGAALEGLQLYLQQPDVVSFMNNNAHTTNKDNNDVKDDDSATTKLTPESTKYLWKSLSSTKPSLRRKTYTLLSSVCQRVPWLIDNDKTSKALLQCLNSEKHPSNIGPLLETILTFVVSLQKQHQQQPTRTTNPNIIMGQYAKSIAKAFKKGCHGASASQWTPMVLPLVALLPSSDNDTCDGLPAQPNVLTCVWEGRKHVVGMADTFQVVQAVAETACFLLVQPQKRDDTDVFTEVIAKCWIQSLQTYLMTTTKLVGPAVQAYTKLGTTLCQGWVQLNHACQNKPQSTIFNISTWFWHQEVSAILLQDSIDNQRLTHLLREIHSIIQSTTSDNKNNDNTSFVPMLRDKFHALLSPIKTKSNWVPPSDVYNVWIAILQLAPSKTIFAVKEEGGEQQKSLGEAFVMNDILRWMVLHTSKLSSHVDEQLSILDVTLFHEMVCGGSDEDDDKKLSPSAADPAASPSKAATSQWGCLLREIIAAQPDLQILMKTFIILWNKGWTVQNLASSSSGSIVSDFCIQVAQSAVTDSIANQHHHHAQHCSSYQENDTESEATDLAHDEGSVTTAQFLQGCVGLGEISELLVGETAIEALVNCACPTADSFVQEMVANPVLDTLVCMIKGSKFMDNTEIVYRVLVQTWRQGGPSWNDEVLPWILETKNRQMCLSLTDILSRESNNQIKNLSSQSDYDDNKAWAWTDRAYRLLQLCDVSSINTDLRPPSLSVIGLADITNWEEGSIQYLSQCLMRLIRHFDGPKKWSLFVNADVDTLDLLLSILISLSGGSANPLEADAARRRKDQCFELLSELDFCYLDSKIILDSCCHCISNLSTYLRESSPDERKVCQSVAVLSQLIGSRFMSMGAAGSIELAKNQLVASDIRVGEKVLYITNAQKPSTQELCTIAKIHTDSPDEVYFTIRLERDGTVQERQTVGERLQKYPAAQDDGCESGENATDELSDEEVVGRMRIIDKIVDELLTPFAENWTDPCYEIYNIILTQCGLLGGRGIGSIHYSIVQKLLEIQKRLLSLLASVNVNKSLLSSTLWNLAMALGFGINTPTSSWGMSLLGLNAADFLQCLLTYGEDEEKESSMEVDCAMAGLLAILPHSCEHQELRMQAYSLLFHVSSRLFQYDGDNFNTCHYIALRAIEAGQVESHKVGQGESMLQDSEAGALTEMIKAFSSHWKDSSVSSSTQLELSRLKQWDSFPVFNSVMDGSLKERPQFLAIASRQCIDSLVAALYNASKRRYAMLLLLTFADEGQPLHGDNSGDDIINAQTLCRLKMWSQDLLEEEAEELEDDVAIVAQWICKEQMNDLESWHDDYNIDDQKACGRMLSWLFFLQILDAAASKDSINRPAFTSYVNKTFAISAMLDLAMVYGNIGSNQKVKLDQVVSLDRILYIQNNIQGDTFSSSLELSKLASLVIFRSVEVFPTLSKNWWETTCPSYLTQTVQEFVETQVSPEILKHSMASIKDTSAFGEMQVKGSPISREVTATYVQDDFTLSVVIKLPLSFPFRRAEVDCSKTLGVPESRWKRWSLQITQMLNNQSGTLKDALFLWKENVDKEFEGIEPCPVCYSVLHVKSHKLPNMECKTCHNHFHSDCLFEWFRSSGKSACVLCQQPWSGTRI